MRVVPYAFQCAHGLGCQGESLLDVIVIGQAKGNVGAKILEMLAKGDTAILNINQLGFLKHVTEHSFLLPPQPCIVLMLVVVVIDCIVAIGECVIIITAFSNVCDGEGKHRIKEAGGGDTHSVFDGAPALPICILRPNLAKCL